MAGEFAVVLEVLLDNIYAFHFIEEGDDLPMYVFHGNINCPEKFESVSWVFRTNSTLLYSIDEFQSHFRKKRR